MYCVIRDIFKGMVNDGKARKLEKWCQRLYGHAGLFSTAADMGKFASMMLSGNLLDSQFVNKFALGGYTGNQLTIDYRNQLYIFMASNRCHNRIG